MTDALMLSQTKSEMISQNLKQILDDKNKVADSIELKDIGNFNVANVALKEVKDILKTIEDQKKDITKPINDHLKFLRGIFKPVEEYCESIKVKFESKITIYLKAEQEKSLALEKAKREEELKKIEADKQAAITGSIIFDDQELVDKATELTQKKVDLENKAITAQKTFGDEVKTTLKQVWTFELTDETKVPRQFLSVDDKKIKQAIRDGVRDIAGVRIYQDAQLAQR